MRREPASQSQRQIRDLLAHQSPCQIGQHGWVTLTGDQRGDHRSARHPEGIRCHRVQLDPAILEHFMQPLGLPSTFLGQLPAVPGQLPDRGDLRRRNETATQQSHLAQLRQPYRIGGVGLRPGTFLTW